MTLYPLGSILSPEKNLKTIGPFKPIFCIVPQKIPELAIMVAIALSFSPLIQKTIKIISSKYHGIRVYTLEVISKSLGELTFVEVNRAFTFHIFKGVFKDYLQGVFHIFTLTGFQGCIF